MKIYNDKARVIIPATRTTSGYYEVPYTEYRTDGTVRGKGWEDFSTERYHAQVRLYEVWTWDGKTYNKGGKRWFERRERCRTGGTPAELKTVYLKNFCPDATPPADVSIRKIL